MADTSSDRSLRSRLGHAPWWVLALILGSVFGLLIGLYRGLTSGDLMEGLTAGVINALVFGPMMAASVVWQRERIVPVLKALPAGQRRAAKRAAWRGPVPTDPAVREAALELATQQCGLFRRLRPWVLGMAGVLGVVAVVGGLLVDLLVLWLGLALVAFAVVVCVVQGIRLPRRVAALRGDALRRDA